MEKNKWMKYVLVVLPMVAVILAGMANSVTVYSPDSAEPAYCSYFTLLEDVAGAGCLPLAAFFAMATFGVAVVYLVKPSVRWVKVVLALSFAAATLAVVPIMVRGDVLVIPNMLVPILLLTDSVLAYGIMKQIQPEQPQKKGKRL